MNLSETRIIRLVEVAVVAALAQVPALLASQSVRNLIANHPAWAVYVPIAASVALELYTYLKGKWQVKQAPKK